MPREGWYSNQSSGRYIVRTRERVLRPYVSTGAQTGLTEKERLARRIKKQGSGMGMGGLGTSSTFGNTTMSTQGNFFSPQLSTDFLELPQSLREKREIYRHFYNTDELVGQAIDLHTELPLSKVRLAPPKPRGFPKEYKDAHDYGQYILSRFERMCKRIKLFQRLITMVHHYWLDGTCPIFAEDGAVDTPMGVGHDLRVEPRSQVSEHGEAIEFDEEIWTPKGDAETAELAHYQKNYEGWERLIILPIDNVKISTFSFTDKVKIELIPSDRDRALLDKARQGDPVAQEMAEYIPAEVRQYMDEGRLIPMGTDPDEGSFVYLLMGRKHAGDELGQSILDRCHLPGTPVLVKRGGQVLEVPIEDLDPDLDLVLSGKGVWREFEHGLRAVDEEITILEVSKIDEPVACTRDHKYPVLRAGKVVELEAGAIQAGDYLQVAQIPLTESLTGVDFGEVLDGTNEDCKARKSGAEVAQTITIIDRTATTVTARYSKPETNPRGQIHLGGVERAWTWLNELPEPTTLRALKFCERFGFGHCALERVLERLRELGACFRIIGRPHETSSAFDIEFAPARLSPLQTDRVVVKVFPANLKLDTEAGYFMGFWLGDGHITKQLGLAYGALGITYGPNEAASVLALNRVVKPFLDRMKVAWSESPMKFGVHMSGYQDALVRWMAGNFGHTGDDKHLPAWIFEAPKAFLLGLLRGFVDSDGDVTQKKDGSVSVRMNGSNPVLMSQVFLLCTSLGLPVSKTKPTDARMVKQADGRMSPAKPSYAVHFTHGPSVKAFFESGFLAKRLEPDVWKDGRSGSRHTVHEGSLYYRVKSVGSASHRGLVHSLNVHVDHSFYVRGIITENCLRTLYFREKLRQAQTSIASRAMTPKRIVWAEGLSDSDTEQLRQQVDLALVDPDYSIVANYEIRWEEMGSRDRLLDLSSEYEQTERRLLSGLGVTESLMSGESLYSGDRLKLEVINTRYLHLREIIQDYVEHSLFEPVARRMGFVEKDEWGQEVVLFPKLSFTRLPLRDTQDTYDALFNLYQKGSISIDLILEMFNIDADDTREKLERDLFTVNDAMFNEVVRSAGNEVGRVLVEKTDLVDRVGKYLKLTVKAEPPAEEEGGGGGRFG